MSTSPPPPPFRPDGGSYLGAPGYDRRSLRAQRRAAAEQARLQTAAFRAQTKADARLRRRTSIVGPLLLLGLGVVLLLMETGTLQWQSTLSWLGRWWPAILILAGLVLVAEWGFDRQAMRGESLPAPSRRSLSSGAVFLLLLLVTAGIAARGMQRGGDWVQRGLDDSLRGSGLRNWQQLFGVRSEVTEDLQVPLADNGRLTIEDPHGDITVTGSSVDGQVHVAVHQHIFAWQEGAVDEHRRAERVRFSGDSMQRTLLAASSEENDTDLTLEVPHDAALTIHSTHGNVTLEELRGSLDIHAEDGDVKLTALRGPVHLVTADDDASVIAHSLAGGLTLEGRSGDIDLSDIDGPVTLHGDFFGTTQMERVRGPVRFGSSFTDFACAGVPGSLHIEGRSDLEAERLLGPVTLATTNRNLTLNDIRGGATITDRNGSVNLSLAGVPEPVRVANENGSIHLSIPTDGSFSLQAHTNNGSIRSDFGPEVRKSGETADLTTQIGSGGPKLDLKTTEGDISLRRGKGQDAAETDDTAETISPVPENAGHTAERRLHRFL